MAPLCPPTQERRPWGLKHSLEPFGRGFRVVWPWPSSSLPANPQFCGTPPTPGDMLFLVDGSWSVGHSHFQQVKDFLASIIEPFEIGPNKVQVGGYQPPAPPPCPRCPHKSYPHPGEAQF